ncbi:hypothetical protein M885DRAFT_529160 [Pelagophyceae sp. CCMP2097]|nr:hypothetical protein M885DRAFT_529160 [Pelagophyceae sp. CCMP2097]
MSWMSRESLEVQSARFCGCETWSQRIVALPRICLAWSVSPSSTWFDAQLWRIPASSNGAEIVAASPAPRACSCAGVASASTAPSYSAAAAAPSPRDCARLARRSSETARSSPVCRRSAWRHCVSAAARWRCFSVESQHCLAASSCASAAAAATTAVDFLFLEEPIPPFEVIRSSVESRARAVDAASPRFRASRAYKARGRLRKRCGTPRGK